MVEQPSTDDPIELLREQIRAATDAAAAPDPATAATDRS